MKISKIFKKMHKIKIIQRPNINLFKVIPIKQTKDSNSSLKQMNNLNNKTLEFKVLKKD